MARPGRKTNRERDLRRTLADQDIEALMWWVLTDHKDAFLARDKEALAGYVRVALDHLAKLHLRRVISGDAGRTTTEDAVAELENVLRLVK
jgi:hypothetical protein